MEFKLSKKFEGVRVISSERSDGPMNYNLDGGANLLSFIKRIGIQKEVAYGEQVHKSVITFCTKPGRYSGADGVFAKDDLALAVKTADCAPLIFFEKQSGAIGAVHISRHNIITGIIDSLARVLEEKNINLSSTAIFLGPHIRKENYKLSDQALKEISTSCFNSYIDSEGRFDLSRAICLSLEQRGFLEENIEDCGIDTFTSPSFYSSRVDRKSGKNINVFATIISKKYDM